MTRFWILIILSCATVLASLLPLSVSAAPEAFCNGQMGVINTGLGCIDITTPSAFLTPLLRWAVGLSSLIAIVSFVFAGIMVLTSAGDPKKVKAGQELILTTIWGVVFIALSVVILNFIGITILNLGSIGFNI